MTLPAWQDLEFSESCFLCGRVTENLDFETPRKTVQEKSILKNE